MLVFSNRNLRHSLRQITVDALRVVYRESTFMSLLTFFAGLFLLVAGANALVRGASKLALSFGISPLVVGLTIVAFGTSAPAGRAPETIATASRLVTCPKRDSVPARAPRPMVSSLILVPRRKAATMRLTEYKI